MTSTALIIGSTKHEKYTQVLVKKLQQRTHCDEFCLREIFQSNSTSNEASSKNSLSGSRYAHDKKLKAQQLIQALSTYTHLVFATSVHSYAQDPSLQLFLDLLCESESSLWASATLRGKQCSILSTGNTSQIPNYLEDVLRYSFDFLGMNYRGVIHCDTYLNPDFSRNAIQLNALASSLEKKAG